MSLRCAGRRTVLQVLLAAVPVPVEPCSSLDPQRFHMHMHNDSVVCSNSAVDDVGYLWRAVYPAWCAVLLGKVAGDTVSASWPPSRRSIGNRPGRRLWHRSLIRESRFLRLGM